MLTYLMLYIEHAVGFSVPSKCIAIADLRQWLKQQFASAAQSFHKWLYLVQNNLKDYFYKYLSVWVPLHSSDTNWKLLTFWSSVLLSSKVTAAHTLSGK